MNKRLPAAERTAQEGFSAFKSGRYQAALSSFSKALALAPRQNTWTLPSQAICYLAIGRPLGTLAAIDRFSFIHPKRMTPSLKALKQEALSQAQNRGLPRMPPDGLHLKSSAPPESRKLLGAAAGLSFRIEYATVKKDLRNLGFVDLDDNSNLPETLKKDGLKMRPLRRIKKYSGFAHHHIKASSSDADAVMHTAFSRSTLVLDEVENIFNGPMDSAAHERLGVLLGYPSCCIKFFKHQWMDLQIWDPIFESAENTPHRKLSTIPCGHKASIAGHPYCNTMLRYAGIRIGSWLACSFDCAKSIALAAEWAEVGKTIDPQAMDALLKILSWPVSWTCCMGRVLVEGRDFLIGGKSFYAPELRVVDYSSFHNRRSL